MNRCVQPVGWRETGDSLIPWEAIVLGKRWQVRLNDFPEERLYSLLVDGVVVEEFNDWPAAWERPGNKSESPLPPHESRDHTG
jgi:hypothetical protein